MKKLNNKGFSLVELIIVIAIMAILVGVVGTQVIPYLEKSREGKDMQVFSSWNTAGMSAYSMNADKVKTATQIKITVGKSGTSVDPATETDVLNTFNDLTNLATSGVAPFANLASKKGKALDSVVITIDVDDESVSTYCGTDFGTITNQ